MSTILQIKQQMAAYLGRTDVDDLNPSNIPPPNTGPDIDLGLYGPNQARLKIERMIDFPYAQAFGSLSIASTGSLISTTTGLLANATVKRVVSVRVPVAGGDYLPVEFLTEPEFEDRVKSMVGRQAYVAAETLAQMGVAFSNPVAYQLGQKLFLAPAAQFTFPVSAQVNVIQFMPDYAADADHDFFSDVAPDYLLWGGILEANKFFRRFVVKNEGNIDEAAVKELADEALQALIRWNADIAGGTSTPPQG